MRNPFSSATAEKTKKLEIILASPTGKAILKEAEGEVLAERIALAKRRIEAPKTGAKAIATAVAERDKAAARREKAKLEYDAALEAHMDSIRNAYAASYAVDREVSDIEQRLRETADPRIWTFSSHLDAISDDFRHHINPTNYTRVTRAQEVIRDARKRLELIKYEAASREEVSRILRSLADELVPVLAEVDQRPPAVFEESIGKAYPWGSTRPAVEETLQ